MGQVALGFRSLFFKLAIFVVLAAMLAAALGGSLLPKPRHFPLPESATVGDVALGWELTLTGREEKPFAWRLLRRAPPALPEILDEGPYEDVAGPVAHHGDLAWGVRRDGRWRLVRHSASGIRSESTVSDRLALEWALVRLEAGLAPGDAAELGILRDAAGADTWPPVPSARGGA